MTPVAVLLRQPWMAAPETAAVMRALGAGEGRARFVGGLVRDALLGRAVEDIDIASADPPDRVMERLAGAGIRVVPTGLAHGTVTAIRDGRHFEITTLRRDVETDGRRAVVAYTDDWAEDARRRDFTVNALFADADGTLYDPVGGLDDLVARRVRFVGDPETRIREDVLRLLRFYRMLARFGRAADGASRDACRRLAPLLPGLSGERVQGELRRMLAVDDPRPVSRMMAADAVLAPILPALTDIDRLAALVELEPAPDWLRRLAALATGDGATAAGIADRLRLSRPDARRLVALAPPATAADLPADDPARRRRLHAVGGAVLRDRALLAAAAGLDRAGVLPAVLAAAGWTRPRFPLHGRDALALGLAPGPEVGRLLALVQAWWEAADFAPDAAACRAELARRAAAAPVAPVPREI